MTIDKAHILDLLRSFPFINDVVDKGENRSCWTIAIGFPIKEGEVLWFDMNVVSKVSPMKQRGASPIKFVNKDLIAYPHIMNDGGLCLHTPDQISWDGRIYAEIEALHEWIEKYYVRGEKEEHYDDLVVEHLVTKDSMMQFYFTQLNAILPVGSYGEVLFTNLSKGISDGYTINNFIVQCVSWGNKIACGEWSKDYLAMEPHYKGLYVMLSGSPALYNKFAYRQYDELCGLCTDNQLNYIHRNLYGGDKYPFVFWGYKTPSGRLRWLVTCPTEDEHIIRGIKTRLNGETKYVPKLQPVELKCVYAEECSYDNYFGRGRFPDAIVNKKILIVGIGALGSAVATTLTRCGARKIVLCDYDQKHPGNVCRSEYLFETGRTKKTNELKQILSAISPFVEVTEDTDMCNFKLHVSAGGKNAEPKLNEFDIVFDCSIDGELMWAIDQVNTTAQIVNLSISNKANELVCAFSPGICDFVTRIYTDIIKRNERDLYNPEGCWSPTFKASYNDVQVMLQYAMRYIVKMLCGEMNKANFMVKEIDEALCFIRW